MHCHVSLSPVVLFYLLTDVFKALPDSDDGGQSAGPPTLAKGQVSLGPYTLPPLPGDSDINPLPHKSLIGHFISFFN